MHIVRVGGWGVTFSKVVYVVKINKKYEIYAYRQGWWMGCDILKSSLYSGLL